VAVVVVRFELAVVDESGCEERVSEVKVVLLSKVVGLGLDALLCLVDRLVFDSSALPLRGKLDGDPPRLCNLARKSPSKLCLEFSLSVWGRSVVFLKLVPLAVLLKSGSVAVNGGLGGAASVVADLGAVPALDGESRPRSVGSGVYKDNLGLGTLSLAPTASLLCALEKVGYGVLAFEPAGDAAEPLRSISGTSMEVPRLEDVP